MNLSGLTNSPHVGNSWQPAHSESSRGLRRVRLRGGRIWLGHQFGLQHDKKEQNKDGQRSERREQHHVAQAKVVVDISKHCRLEDRPAEGSKKNTVVESGMATEAPANLLCNQRVNGCK